jgi:hypothetical protein
MNAGRTFFALTVTAATLFAAGCASEEDGDDETSYDELRSEPIGKSDMVKIKAPAGMPEVWTQPGSEGIFDQKGKCGPTAVANALRLYGISVSPEQADKDGVHFVVGSLARNLHKYLDKFHPQLDCEVDHPFNGTKYLRNKLDGGHPVMIWFNTNSGFAESHWVVAVGHRGEGDAEKVIVMSWGNYYEIGMQKLERAWRWVLGLPHPAVVCKATTDKIVR